jgi:hypothetical protein
MKDATWSAWRIPTAVFSASYTGIYFNYFIYIYIWPPLWFNGQSSWLHIQRSRFDSRRYQIFRKVVGLERGLLSLADTTDELFRRKSSGSGLKNSEYCHRDPFCWPGNNLYPQKLALASQTSGGRSVCVIRSRSEATEFDCCYIYFYWILNSVNSRQNYYFLNQKSLLTCWYWHAKKSLCWY